MLEINPNRFPNLLGDLLGDLSRDAGLTLAVLFELNNLLKRPGGGRGGVTGTEDEVAIGCIFVETAAAAAAGDASSDGEAGVKLFLIIAVSSLRYCKFPSGS